MTNQAGVITPETFKYAMVLAKTAKGSGLSAQQASDNLRRMASSCGMSMDHFTKECARLADEGIRAGQITFGNGVVVPIDRDVSAVTNEPLDLLQESPETLAFLVATTRKRNEELEAKNESLARSLRECREQYQSLQKQHSDLAIEKRVDRVIGQPPAQKPPVKLFLGLYTMLGCFALIMLARLVFDIWKVWH
jgi:hypothetical protein